MATSKLPVSTCRSACPGRRATTCRTEPCTWPPKRRSRSPKESPGTRSRRLVRAIDEALSGGLGVAHEAVRLAFPVALEAAIDLGDLEEADRLTETLVARPPGEVPPFLRAQVARAKALVAARTR